MNEGERENELPGKLDLDFQLKLLKCVKLFGRL